MSLVVLVCGFGCSCLLLFNGLVVIVGIVRCFLRMDCWWALLRICFSSGLVATGCLLVIIGFMFFDWSLRGLNVVVH